MASFTIIVAFFAGLLSFFSPCILPIVPGFLAYLTGAHAKETISRKRTFLSSVFFVLGFGLVFALLGVLLNTVLEGISYGVQIWLGRIGGLIIILFALQILGLVRIPFLMQEHKIEVKNFRTHYLTSFLFGASFAVGWSPCVGALLGSIFALAVSQPGTAFVLLIGYSLGLGVPFLFVGAFSDKVFVWLRKSQKFLRYFNIVVGSLLLILGVLVFTNNLNLAAYLIPQGVFG